MQIFVGVRIQVLTDPLAERSTCLAHIKGTTISPQVTSYTSVFCIRGTESFNGGDVTQNAHRVEAGVDAGCQKFCAIMDTSSSNDVRRQ